MERNYQDTIDYLFAKLPMFSRIGAAAYKKDLTNTIAICNALDNPQNKFKTIHVAGTNGKGSTSHMLAAILQTAGYKTGLYTSPHLHDFRERIKINGEMIPQQFVIDFTKKMEPIIAELEPSFFEITVGMAFEYFANEKVDFAVIETGLGGRLDSTNVITPILSIITNIGYDHQNMLGNTLELIAGEKAGIIKPTVPVIIGETLPETLPVFMQKAKECNAPIHFAEKEIIHNQGFCYSNKLTKNTELYFPDLKGNYQVKNLKSILVAVHLLNSFGFSISYETTQNALKKVIPLTGLHGRWESVEYKNRTIILDVAHNVDGVSQLVQSIHEEKDSIDLDFQFHLVLGMVKDKDIEAVLALLPKDAIYYFTQANLPRALPKEDLQEKAKQHGLQGNAYNNVNIAIDAAIKNAENFDTIIVFGSVFLVGEVEY